MKLRVCLVFTLGRALATANGLLAQEQEELAADRCKLMDFYHQAKLGMSVEHPRVLQVLEVGHAAGRHFVATEFLGLPSLKYQIKHGFPDRKRFEEKDAVRIVYQLARILEAPHRITSTSAKVSARISFSCHRGLTGNTPTSMLLTILIKLKPATTLRIWNKP